MENEENEVDQYALVSLPWLLKNIEERNHEAQQNAYKKFRAALLIQRFYAEWKAAKTLIIHIRNVIIIQKYAKRYLARKKFHALLEGEVQQRLIHHYNHHATTVQKWWRGYYSRKHKHDFLKLKELQRAAAKELILCVALKLHHLLRTYQIPGVYSLRNTKILSKIEELLAALKFKEFNELVRKAKAATEDKIKRTPKNVQKISPYGPKCQVFFKTAKIEDMYIMLETLDPRMFKRSKRGGALSSSQEEKFKETARNLVVECMEKWSLLENDRNLSVRKDIVEKPKSIENFLNEVESICRCSKIFTESPRPIKSNSSLRSI